MCVLREIHTDLPVWFEHFSFQLDSFWVNCLTEMLHDETSMCIRASFARRPDAMIPEDLIYTARNCLIQVFCADQGDVALFMRFFRQPLGMNCIRKTNES